MNSPKASKQLLKNLESIQSLLTTPKLALDVPPPILPVDDPSQASSSLYQAISRLIRCNCELSELPTIACRAHRGYLQLSKTAVHTRKDGYVFDTSFAIAPAHCDGPTTLWQQMRIRIPKRLAKVAFEVDEANEGSQHHSGKPQQMAADARLLTDLCQLLKKNFGPNRYALVVDGSQLFDTEDQDFADFNVLPTDTLSLERALRSLTPTGDARLLLVKIVVQSFLAFLRH